MKIFFILASLLLLSGCATVGKEFDFFGPSEIKIGQTTKANIVSRFGKPFRVGYDNGQTQWTYAHYKYSLFSEAETKDLIIRFDDKGIVTNYSYNSSLEEDRVKMLVER